MKLVSTTFLLVLLLSCGGTNKCPKSIHVKLKNLTGLDGCGWVLQKNDGKYLEPTNLNKFDIELNDGKDLHVEYKSVDGASICMVGEIVEIKCLSED
jgi:hypothetical protein